MDSQLIAEIVFAATIVFTLPAVLILQLRQTREILRSQEERSYKEREYELRSSGQTQERIAQLQESLDSLRSFLPQFDASPRNLEQATAELHEVVQILRNQTADVSMKDSVAATDDLHVDKDAGIDASDKAAVKEDRRIDNNADASDPGVVTDELRIYENVAVQYRHSVKTPLSSIVSAVGNMQTYLDRLASPQEHDTEEAREIVARSLDVAQLSIDSIRDILSHGAGFLPGTAGPVDIAEVVRRAERITRSNAQSKAELTVQLGSVNVIKSHFANIQLTMIQLLENAFDAVGDSGHIVVESQTDTGRKEVTIKVSNNGPVITRRVASKLFKAPISTKGPNRGTGLLVARQAMEAINGDVKLVRSDAELTQFRLRITEVS
jgi:signal transduction histidine kinase